MASIYTDYINRAKAAVRPTVVEPSDMTTILGALSPVLELARELQREGLLVSDSEERRFDNGIEYRWRLSESRFLVVQGLAPILDPTWKPQARIVAGISDSNRMFFGMPACGWYPAPAPSEDIRNTHWLILTAVADIVAQCRIGLGC